MSSYEEHAEGVRDDYHEALEGLTMNTRVEINNLTMIARENTEFAFVIADVLQEHIKRVNAQRKLPALYLLDSIVKNVGSPYTHFFAKNLYSIYMETYASVDNQIRQKMHEMLRTWKEPVPGSVDTRPVFPIESTRPIENALIKARNSALQAQHEDFRNQQKLMGRPGPGLGRGGPPMQQPYRETPTPPGGRNGPFPGAPPPQGQPQHPMTNGNPHGGPQFSQQQHSQHQPYPPNQQHQYPNRSTPQPPQSAPASTAFPPPTYPLHGAAVPGAPSGLSIGSLTGDIERLIDTTRAEFARNIHDTSVQTRLKALLDLQTLLTSGLVQPDQLMLIKNQIDALSVNMHGLSKAQTFTPTPPTTTAPYSLPPAVPQPVATPVAPPASAPPATVTLDSLLGRGASSGLAAFLRNSATPQASTPAIAPQPPIRQQHAPPRPVSAVAGGNVGVTPPPAAPAGVTDALSVVAMLKAKGLLPGMPPAGNPQPSVTSPVVPIMAPTPVSLAGGLASIIAQAKAGGLGRQPLQDVNGIQLSAASLKRVRRDLIPRLHDDLGAPCTQCGRRFKADEKGRARKMAHMDWHFRVHRRMTESEKRGQHRSWYTDSNDWVHSRESVDTDHAQTSPDGSVPSSNPSAQGGKQKPAQQWIPVPSGGAAANSACPICQEQFEMKWLDEAQEWVWMDAVSVKQPGGGIRVYHASCHEEATRVVAEATPDRVLGKRKAEQDGHAFRGKMKEGGW